MVLEPGGIPPERIFYIKLLNLLDKRFDEEELRTLCFSLGVDYDNLPAQGAKNKARELIKYLNRRDRIPALVKAGKNLRSEIPWPDIDSVTETPPRRHQSDSQVTNEKSHYFNTETFISSLVEYHQEQDLRENILSLPSNWYCQRFLASSRSSSNSADYDTNALDTALQYLFLEVGPYNAMHKCCDPDSLCDLLQDEMGEDYQTDILEDAIERVMEVFSVPNTFISPGYWVSLPEAIRFVEGLEHAVKARSHSEQFGTLSLPHDIISIWKLIERLLELSMGYFCLYFDRFLPDKIIRSLKTSLDELSVDVADEYTHWADEYTHWEEGIKHLLGQLGTKHPRYSDALVYQQRLHDVVEEARLYGPTSQLKAEQARIVHQLNRISTDEIGISFNAVCNIRLSVVTCSSVMQSLRCLDRFFSIGELPNERESRRRKRRQKLNEVADAEEKAHLRREYEVQERRIQKEKKRESQPLRDLCLRSFGRTSPFRSLNLAFYRNLKDLAQNPLIYVPIAKWFDELQDQELEKATKILKQVRRLFDFLDSAGAVPRLVMIVGNGVDDFGNRILWFVDKYEFQSRQEEYDQELPDCLKWAYITSNMNCRPFQQMAMVTPTIDPEGAGYLIDPVFYPVEEIEAFVQRFE